jgi:hypothetical protein
MWALCLTKPVGLFQPRGIFRAKVALVLLSTLVLAGCAQTTSKDQPISVKAALPEYKLATTDMRYVMPRQALAHMSDQKLSDWFKSITVPSSAVRPESLKIIGFGRWGFHRERILVLEAARLGIPKASLTFNRNRVPLNEEPSLLVQKSIVVYAGCSTDGHEEQQAASLQDPSFRLGCSTAANLGRMVANPLDLEQ